MKARILASAILAATVLVGATGCNLMAPQATTKKYDPSDGISANVGELAIRNALIISDDGVDGSLTFAVSNNGGAEKLRIEYGQDKRSVEVNVPGNTLTSFGAPGTDAIELPGVNTDAGANIDVYFQYGTETGDQVVVPVLTSHLHEYSTLVPSPPADN